MNLILQNITDDISKDSLPVQWQDFDLKLFTKDTAKVPQGYRDYWVDNIEAFFIRL